MKGRLVVNNNLIFLKSKERIITRIEDVQMDLVLDRNVMTIKLN